MPPVPPIGFRGVFRADDDARAAYSESAGILRAMPRAVAVPADAADLQALCAWATESRIPLVPRGSGSSMAGGAVGDGVIVDAHALRAIGPVDQAWHRVDAGAAATIQAVDDAARAVGLRFPVDPSSAAFATVGGAVATNAAGARTMRFGAMRPWVRALDCVFADGTRVRLTRDDEPRVGPILTRWHAEREALRARARALAPRDVRKDSSGYGVHDFAASGALLDLLVGSEGTLACFAGVTLDLLPLPAATASLLASFPTLEGAVHGAALAREGSAIACELLDATFLRVAARGGTLPVPPGAESVLLVELEGERAEACAARAEALATAWRRAGATLVEVGIDPAAQAALWALRHAASPILARLDPNIRSMQVVEDGCVPPHRLPDYVRGVREALAAEDLEGVLFGHAGDAHVHVNALVDVRDPRWEARVRGLFARVVALTASLGGTMAGEHGDGRLRSGALGRFWSAEALDLFRSIKDVFDPAGILNPGVKVGAVADPLAGIKYDPTRPLGSARAARVLAQVESGRRYADFRLELLDRTG